VVPIDDPDAEGVESIYQSVTAKPTYALAAPPATTPATNETTGKRNIDDDPSVQQVWYETRAGDNIKREKGVNGYDFGNLIKVIGEHLDKVKVVQLIKTWSELLDTNGNPLGQADVNAFFGASGDGRMTHTDGQWVADYVNVDGQPVPMTPTAIVVTKANSEGIAMDDSHVLVRPYSTDPNSQRKYIALASHGADFDLVFTKANGQPVKGKKEFIWGYTWGNHGYEWTNQDHPPAPVAHVASPSQDGNPDDVITGYGFNPQEILYVDEVT
jgi:hypothetical protein